MKWDRYITGWRVADVAAALGVPERTVYDWRTGHASPTPWQQDLFRRRLEEWKEAQTVER